MIDNSKSNNSMADKAGRSRVETLAVNKTPAVFDDVPKPQHDDIELLIRTIAIRADGFWSLHRLSDMKRLFSAVPSH